MRRKISSGSNLGMEDHRRARQQDDVRRHEQPVRVEDRQRVQQHVVGGEAPRRRAGVSALEARLSCVSIAPFERPVVPEV